MTYDLKRIEKEFTAICKKAKVNLDTPILINGRLKSTLGRVCYEWVFDTVIPTKIEFSKHFIESSSDNDVYDVILHEAAHYIATTRTGERHGHDNYFKAICAEIGTCNDRTFFVEREAASKTKYVVKCGCGFERGYARRGKVIEQGICPNCGGSLDIEQNW